jgi:hypothetical protein
MHVVTVLSPTLRTPLPLRVLSFTILPPQPQNTGRPCREMNSTRQSAAHDTAVIRRRWKHGSTTTMDVVFLKQ